MLFCVDGYQYGGKPFDRAPARWTRSSPRLHHAEARHQLPYLEPGRAARRRRGPSWDELLDHPPVSRAEFQFEQVPFDHPLWILFSSGTTGLPKPIMHSHGGITARAAEAAAPSTSTCAPASGMFFFTTTGWMMWNFLVSSLLSDVLPGAVRRQPGLARRRTCCGRWCRTRKASFFGASPTYVHPREGRHRAEGSSICRACDSITLAGSPVSAECQAWFYDNVKQDLWVAPAAAAPTSAPASSAAWPPCRCTPARSRRAPGRGRVCVRRARRAVIDEVGEMVVTEPMPSMPVGFWNDHDDAATSSPTSPTSPACWRQGDFFRINERGGCFVLGRSDATLNRHGVRIGTAEIYRSMRAGPGSRGRADRQPRPARRQFFMPLFVKLAERRGAGRRRCARRSATGCAASTRRATCRTGSSRCRHIPYTLTGKKMEVPVRRILLGMAPDAAGQPQRDGRPGRPGLVHQLRPDPAGLPAG